LDEDASLAVHVPVELDQNTVLGPGEIAPPEEPPGGIAHVVLHDGRRQPRLVDKPSEDGLHR
jgi:hypothetical protein